MDATLGSTLTPEMRRQREKEREREEGSYSGGGRRRRGGSRLQGEKMKGGGERERVSM